MAVYCVEYRDTGPFYHGLPLYTVVYGCKLLSFSTQAFILYNVWCTHAPHEATIERIMQAHDKFPPISVLVYIHEIYTWNTPKVHVL